LSEILKVQPKCYFITPEHASSFWGKYLYLYSGHGELKLSTESLDFESKSLSLHIPLQMIMKIGVETFSKWTKPFGLTYMVLQFLDNGQERTIFLVPAISALAPSWKTCKIVEEWITALGQLDGLSGRIQLPIPQVNPPTILQLVAFFLLLLGVYAILLLIILPILG